MREAVSDILVERAQSADRFSSMVLYSLIAHGVLITAIVLMPERWRRSEVDPQAQVITITFGGATGPDTGGHTPLSRRPVQEVSPPEQKPAPQPVPAAKQPEMVLPSPVVKPAPKTPPKPVQKPDDASATRKPTTGPELKTGAARVDTRGVETQFPGLSTQSGGDEGGARTEISNFCCPEYIRTMNRLIRANWKQDQGAAGKVEVKFVIQRNGQITAATVDKPSGLFQLDQEALRAVMKTKMLPPLPAEFPDKSLTIYLTFEYLHR